MLLFALFPLQAKTPRACKYNAFFLSLSFLVSSSTRLLPLSIHLTICLQHLPLPPSLSTKAKHQHHWVSAHILLHHEIISEHNCRTCLAWLVRELTHTHTQTDMSYANIVMFIHKSSKYHTAATTTGHREREKQPGMSSIASVYMNDCVCV